jgi:hypothetical protein
MPTAMGEPLTDAERVVFKRCTGRERESGEQVEELWAIIGRRGGKSFAIAVLIVFLAIFRDYRHVLTVGERAVVLCLAQNQEQARVVYGYVCGIIEAVPLLAPLIRLKSSEALSLTNGVEVEIRAASFRGLRGVTCVAVVCDEICFWLNADTSARATRRASTGGAARACLALASAWRVTASSERSSASSASSSRPAAARSAFSQGHAATRAAWPSTRRAAMRADVATRCRLRR